MDRRSADRIQRRIAEWERLRADCAPDGGEGVASFIERELDRLHFELAARDRPMPRGRRTGDPSGT